jgi:predicted nucleotidyltransferase
MNKRPGPEDDQVKRFVEALRTRLRDNIYSCIQYGSTVRGDARSGLSDINLLIVLNESTPEAHAALAKILREFPRIDPMVLAVKEIGRSFRAFAITFLSIRRDYRVLHGADPLQDLTIDPEHERFLCEQALRNIRLRLVNSFLRFGHDRRRFSEYLGHLVSPLFVDLSEVLRLEGIDIPHDFAARVQVLEKGFETDTSVLSDLLALKAQGRRLTNAETLTYHGRIYTLLREVIGRMERRWPTPSG